MAASAADIAYLRLLVDDLISDSETEEDARFTDASLDEIFTRSGGNIYRAASEGWTIKAGDYADMVDVDESGSVRKLSQLYKNAKEQANHFFLLGGGVLGFGASLRRVLGKPLSMRERPAITDYTVHPSRKQADPYEGAP